MTFSTGLQGNREQQQIRDENHRHESGGKEQPLFSVVRRDHGKEPSPESMVEHQRDERGDEKYEDLGATGLEHAWSCLLVPLG